MNRFALLVVTTLVLACGVCPSAFGWGSATHAYIALQIGDGQGSADLRVIYGAVLPDACNVMFGDPYQGQLWTLTHYGFQSLVEQAQSEYDKALAYGFASHNESWGADQTAHISAIGAPTRGYVVRKSDELAAILKPQVRFFLLLSGVANPDAVLDDLLPTVTHSAVETAVDLLVCRNEDPDIGRLLLLAAQTRGWSAPILLCNAYAAEFAATVGTTEAVAAGLIVATEDEFRGQIELYGSVLAQEDPLDAMAEQAADLAGQLLAAQQGLVGDGPADLMKQIVTAAIDIVEDDYAAELAATITQVRQELESHAIASP